MVRAVQDDRPHRRCPGDEYDGKVKFAKMDVDSNPRTPMTYGVRGIPTLLIFSGGSPVDQVVGAVPKAALKGRIEKAIA